MAVKGANARLLIDEWDFSPLVASADVEMSVGELESTAFQAVATSFEPGLAAWGVNFRGYHEGKGVGTLEHELRARLATPVVRMGLMTFTDLAACPVYMSDRGWTQAIKLRTPAAELMTIEANFSKALPLVRGLRVYEGTLTGTGDQAAVDFGAAGAAGGLAYLWVQGITGTATNAQIKLRHATTQGGAYSDLGTFTFSAVGSLGIAFAGTVSRWLRANVVTLGGATQIRCALAAAVYGVTG